MNELPSRKPRSVHSKRGAIRAAIVRRLATAEPLSIRAILKEAGGGSTDTAREELASLKPADARIAQALTGHTMRNVGEEICALRTALDASLQREAMLGAEVAGLRETVASSARTIEYLVSRHDDTYRQMLVDLDSFREAAKTVPELKAATDRPVRPAAVEIIPDLVLEGKYRLQVQANARQHQLIRTLEQQLATLRPQSPATVSHDDDEVYQH
jgi:hypothetical protein